MKIHTCINNKNICSDEHKLLIASLSKIIQSSHRETQRLIKKSNKT